VETLCEVCITDLFFTHERGRYIGLYTLFLFVGNYCGPIISGFIYDSQGWHWVMYWTAIINAVMFVILLVLLEETSYPRNRGGGQISKQRSDNDPDEKKTISNDKGQDPGTPLDHRSCDVLETSDEKSSQLKGTPTPLLTRLAIFNRRLAPNGMLLTTVWRPLLLLRFPSVFWAGFQYGTCLVWYNVLNATCSLILSDAPYNFQASYVGLAYFGPLIGMIIGTFYSGYIGDLFSIASAKRSAGVREPENRLWLMCICLVLCPSSLILWGVGAAHHIHWPALVIGMGMISCSTGIGSALSIGYALDSYRDLSGEVMMAVIIVRNTLSFAIGYGINPWLDMGLQNTFICAAFVGMTINMSFLGVIRWGKGWRKKSTKQYWSYVDKGSLMAH